MRHRVDGRKFNRSGSHRKAMFRRLVANLILHEKIVTTDAKAKEVRRVTEKLVSKAKKVGKALGKSRLTKKQRLDRLSAYREIRKWLPMEVFDQEGLSVSLPGKLLDEIAPRYAETRGGYTRIFKVGNRRGDNAPMAVIEFIPSGKKEEKPTEEKKKKKRRSIFSSRSKKETV
jgi:large subunit ribosomal protein L17